MLCIGRSNYVRFNHPAEARLMKSILPNTRISMAPLALYTGTVLLLLLLLLFLAAASRYTFRIDIGHVPAIHTD
jgi:hypothetical protein